MTSPDREPTDDETNLDPTYTETELMVTRAAQELQDGDAVLVGVGVPTLAAVLAKRRHVPDLEMIYESGTIDADPDRLPLSIADPALAADATSTVSMHETFGRYLQAGRVDVGFLGGAQVDRHGNINSTVIGDYEDLTVRLPGSGGACDIACNTDRTVVLAPHERRRFPETVDFVTSPGYVGGRTGREEAGLRGGPETVITDKAVMGFDADGEMVVETLHPGVSRETVQEATGWELQFADDPGTTPTPTGDELRVLRDDLDPDGIYVGD